MIVIRFGRWSSESGKKWIYTRIFSRRWGAVKRCVFFWRKYWSGATPFCRRKLRYTR